jgi:hypothetical protein
LSIKSVKTDVAARMVKSTSSIVYIHVSHNPSHQIGDHLPADS